MEGALSETSSLRVVSQVWGTAIDQVMWMVRTPRTSQAIGKRWTDARLQVASVPCGLQTSL
jgi:hypothetical protein